jgi:hypothetical protein
MDAFCNKRIKSIHTYSEPGNYGLHLLFAFEDNTSILFEKGYFSFSTAKQHTSFLFSKWIDIHYVQLTDAIYIKKIREDEGNSSFVEFSNSDILHIYQRIIGNVDSWIQDFEIVSRSNVSEFNRVHKYMNEEFVEDVLF